MDLSNETVLGTVGSGNKITDCAYYYAVGTGYGCLSCVKGKNGSVKPIGTNALD